MNYKNIVLSFILFFSTHQAHSMEWISWIIKNPNKSITLVATAYYMCKKIPRIFFWCFANYFPQGIWRGKPLMYYAQKEYDKGKQDFLIYLAKHKYNQLFLCYAYDLYQKDNKNNKNPLFFFLNNGVNPNISFWGHSLLKEACIENDTKLVEKLLEKGAHLDDEHKIINCFYYGGNGGNCLDMWIYSDEINRLGSPLIIAFHKNFPEIIKLLIKYNVKPTLYDKKRKNTDQLLNPSFLLQYNDFIPFNHCIDYHITQENPTLETHDTSLYKYWLIQHRAPQEHCGAFKNVVDKHIMPFYMKLTIFKNFDQGLESLCLFYNFTTKQKKMLYRKRTEILQTRRDNKNSFLPISMPTEEILQTLTS